MGGRADEVNLNTWSADGHSDSLTTHVRLALEIWHSAKLVLSEETGPGKNGSLGRLLQADRVEQQVLGLELVLWKICRMRVDRLYDGVDLSGAERVERVGVAGLGG